MTFIAKPTDRDPQKLFDTGVLVCQEFLRLNGISAPKYRAVRNRSTGQYWRDRGFYLPSEKSVTVNLKNTRRPTKTPGFAWSYPGYKADITAIGVVAHETGHHVQFELGTKHVISAFRKIRDREAPVTSYEPNTGEAFAEAMRLFILNPNLLKIGRPRRWEFLIDLLGLKPLHNLPWKEVLKHAHPRYYKVGAKWIQKGLKEEKS